MRHVSDGELHAYLDGALDLLAEARGEEVRAHLATCAVCQERLHDEKGVREEAQALLDRAVPDALAIPPFEELRARGEAAKAISEPGEDLQDAIPSYRGPLRGAPLAWAATVVLALGVGWMSGEVWRASPPETVQEYLPAESRAEAASDVAGQGLASPVETPPPVMREMEKADAPARSRSSAPGGVEGNSERGAGPAAALLDTPDLSPSPTAPGSMVAELVADHSLAVPGLEVISVQWEEWVPGERGLHIRQLLPMGDTLELRYLGMLMGADAGSSGKNLPERDQPSFEPRDLPPLPSALEVSLPQGWNQVVMKKARGWLVARAPLSEAGLRALLRSLR